MSSQREDYGPQIASLAEGSRIVSFGRSVSERVESLVVRASEESLVVRASEESLVLGVGETVKSWGRSAWLYRWLTTEPDPDVIVIDLRDSYTLGFLLGVFDRVVGRLGPARKSSLATRSVVLTVSKLRERPLRIPGILLAGTTVLNLLIQLGKTEVGRGTLIAHAIAIVVGLLAIQSSLSWDDIEKTGTYRILAAVFGPPPPEESDENH